MTDINQFLIPLILGMLLDTILGDPRWLPHPIRGFGYLIMWFDKTFNKGENRKAKGIFTGLFLVVSVWMFFFGVQKLLTPYPILLVILNTLFFFYAIGSRSLIIESLKVEEEVKKEDLPAARKQLSWIVGRDTSQLSFHKIRTAVLETLSENLSDGVIAPLFYYALGGVPLMMAYKMVNTLDSMIGYKNDKYRDFGWFSARILDDAANYIPARLTAVLMALVSAYPKRAFQFVKKYAQKHASPNSGYPESALAGILDCQFGGPNVYHGQLVEKPFIGDNPRELSHSDMFTAVWINIKVAFAATFMIGMIYYIFF